ncbi:hypothetical protein FOL47_002876 [Perkinsus chesapeaki]|uniref:Uncharacterized protein n=1 Tax=Perkinsus chesapeaki TaxID=330153 RepID=A0A7J6MBJ0_PERCH|nr:hypothetical protein FOL47_002876 [Perkinsus chesapeaki]
MVLPTLARRMLATSTANRMVRPIQAYRMVAARGYKTENPLYKDDEPFPKTCHPFDYTKEGTEKNGLGFYCLMALWAGVFVWDSLYTGATMPTGVHRYVWGPYFPTAWF